MCVGGGGGGGRCIYQSNTSSPEEEQVGAIGWVLRREQEQPFETNVTSHTYGSQYLSLFFLDNLWRF